jgi:hypothetical protein
MKIPCSMLVPTDRAARWLRRFTSAETAGVRLCEPDGYHQAMVRIEDDQLIIHDNGSIAIDPLEWPAADPRWPTRCEHCGYEFHDREIRQLFYMRIYRTQDGREVTIHGSRLPGIEGAPAGSMFFADWMKPLGKGPDERCLVVVTPGGLWYIDGPSTNGPGWTRTGTPPLVTAHPSIDTGRYHGWLREGVLEDA